MLAVSDIIDADCAGMRKRNSFKGGVDVVPKEEACVHQYFHSCINVDWKVSLDVELVVKEGLYF